MSAIAADCIVYLKPALPPTQDELWLRVRDILAVLDKAQKIRKEFGDVPAQHSAIKDE